VTLVTHNNLITRESLLLVSLVMALFSYDGDFGLWASLRYDGDSGLSKVEGDSSLCYTTAPKESKRPPTRQHGKSPYTI
jgi:hypothetical protein